MQGRFDFDGHDLEEWRNRLAPLIAGMTLLPRRPPVWELVKATISSRTYDAVSLAAYNRLRECFPAAPHLAAASPRAVEAAIGEVTFAEAKAPYLIESLSGIGRRHPDFELGFLGRWPLGRALHWLERWPGVGRKVAAAVLNASTLARPVFIVDTHVLRVLRRTGFVARTADYRAASEAVTMHQPDWSGADFLWFHVALKRLGQTLCCWDTPLCAQCPLASLCKTGRSMLGHG
jgi:endonuclease-3